MTDGGGDPALGFDERYRVAADPAMRRAELRVIGSDYGATSYTTKAQADRLAVSLALAPGRLLLDIGSGAGWPGIYLARSTGCRVVLSDLSFDGLQTASRRLQTEEVDGHVLSASGASLPIEDRTFHAATSSDVLC